MFIADSREPAEAVTRLESVLGEAPVRAGLDVGDYMFPTAGLLVERKAVPDLLASIADGRLAQQCTLLAQAKVRLPLLLVHGSLLADKDCRVVADGRRTNWNYWSVCMAFVSAQNAGVVTLLVPDRLWPEAVQHTLQWVGKRTHLVTRDFSLWQPPTQVKLLAILVGNTSRASALLEEYRTVKNALAHVEEWDKVKGIGKASISRALAILNSEDRLDL